MTDTTKRGNMTWHEYRKQELALRRAFILTAIQNAGTVSEAAHKLQIAHPVLFNIKRRLGIKTTVTPTRCKQGAWE